MQLVKTWVIPEKLPAEIDRHLQDFPTLLRQLLYNRGISSPEEAQIYLQASGSLHDPYLLKGMNLAVDRLMAAVAQEEPVAIYGDYDVDGVTATSLLVQVLGRLGAHVRGYIPNRFDEGYGLNNDALDLLAQDGVRVVVTVDCGIRSPREAEHARQLGIDLIISDHHEPRGSLPDAFAVICQKQAGDEYPEKGLAGVGLAYKISEALCHRLEESGVQPEDWLDLVAIGTVADVVPLTGENRSLVRAGLNRLRLQPRQGVVSLAGIGNLDLRRINARDIGFVLGPRLNAAGRLESALAAYDLLMSKDMQQAGLQAQKLDDQNRQRQELTRQMQLVAEDMILDKGNPNLLFVVHPEFNMGVVGLVASRLVENHYRPAIVGYQGDGFIRASCRSISEFHITRALDECAPLMVQHGGHAMAAGFTVSRENLSELEFRMQEIADRELGMRELRPMLRADIELDMATFKPNQVAEIFRILDQIEPTGLGNPEVTFFTRNLRVNDCRTVGADNKHLKLKLKGGQTIFDAIAFRQGHWAGQLPQYLDAIFTFEKNLYMGRENLQLNIRDLRPSQDQP